MTAALQRLEPSRSWTPLSREDHRAIERENAPWYVDRHVETALRGYKLAQEVVNRHEATARNLRAYVADLEAFLVRWDPGFVLPPELVLSRLFAMGGTASFNDIERTT
jgi:hypothetical protein